MFTGGVWWEARSKGEGWILCQYQTTNIKSYKCYMDIYLSFTFIGSVVSVQWNFRLIVIKRGLKMRVTDFRVLTMMNVRCTIFKLLLFQMLVPWCSPKHITIDLSKEVQQPYDDIQDSIRNLIHTGELHSLHTLA